MDIGHKRSDKELKRLEKRLASEYRQAFSDLKQKANDYFKEFEAIDKEMTKQVKDGLMTSKEYREWQREMLQGQQYVTLRDEMARNITEVDRHAREMIQEKTYDVYADNFNFGLYEIENTADIGVNFALYDRNTVRNLAAENPSLLPFNKNLDIPKDLRWNTQKINSALLQGVIQGEPVDKIADRLMRVTDMDASAAIRNARTSITSAENAGRIESYEKAEEMGIKMQKMWVATIDERTRESHVELDGVTIDIDEDFETINGNTLSFPADPAGEPEEVYNCRCTLVAVVGGNEYEGDRVSEKAYEEWKRGKEED